MNAEMADMYMMYRAAMGMEELLRDCIDGKRHVPNYQKFAYLHQKLRETGTF